MSTPAEWTLVRDAVAASYAAEPAAWVAFARCRAVVLHTAGQPAGWAVVVLGWHDSREVTRRRPRARLDLAGPLPIADSRVAPDATRAAAVAVLGALAVVEHLGWQGWKGSRVTIYAAGLDAAGGLPDAYRPADADLWQVYAVESAGLGWVVSGGVALAAAAEAPIYDPPTAADQARQAAGPDDTPAALAPPPTPTASEPAAPGTIGTLPIPSGAPPADYTLILLGPGPDEAEPVGRYGIWTRDGRRRTGTVPLAALQHPDEGEYRTLIAALTELTERIARQRHSPRRYRLAVVSARDAVLAYLQARAAGAAAGRPPGARTARDVLARFAAVTFVRLPAPEIATLLGPAAPVPAEAERAAP